MSQNNSDYKLDRPSVHDMLPAIHQNPLSKALSETTFDRFYTKPELTRVIGTIGQRKSSTADDQIIESDVYDQAFQLQPAIKNSAATETQITTYKDIKRLCEQLGIDTSRVKAWQDAEQYNYALPIHLDKVINFNEYYWVGVEQPEYVTIANPQIRLQAQLSQLVSHYPTSANKAAMWEHIVSAMDTIAANVAIDQQVAIPNLAQIVADSAHPPYVRADVASSAKYQVKSDWASTNKWIHRLDVFDLSIAQQAKMPIVEYNDSVQLTEYTYTEQVWKYRRNASYAWAVESTGPSRAELFHRIEIIGSNRNNDTITVSGDQSVFFVVGEQFTIENSALLNGTTTAVSVIVANGVTTIKIDANVTTDTATGTILPFITTSHGDAWKGLHTHWMLADVKSPVPTTPPELTVTGEIHESAVATEGQTVFTMSTLHLYGDNIARVYVNGRRQYGTYSEVSMFAIKFHKGLPAGAIIKILPHSIASEDANKELYVIRVSEDAAAPLAARSLVKYRKLEQYKTYRNQYPMFDMVNMDGSSSYESTSIMTFAEDSNAPVNAVFGSRIIHDALSKEYTFNITLVRNDGTLRYYINTITNAPTSIWSAGSVYVPSKVDASRNRVGDDTLDAVFEIPQQLMSNVHHECRSTLKYSEMFLHFKSIVDQQPAADVEMYGANMTPANSYRIKDDIQYGVGGTIKDHAYSFDNFVSSLISSNYTMPMILTFAENQYKEMLVKTREFVEQNLVNAIASSAHTSIDDLVSHIETKVLASLRNDTGLSRIYGDSSVTLQSSVTNWIATLPYLRLANAAVPSIIRDDKLGILELTHHDGHTSASELNAVTSATAKAALIKALKLYPNNVQQLRPTEQITAGMLWYDAVLKKVFRLDVALIGRIMPMPTFANGEYFYKVDTHTLYVIQGGQWVMTADAIESRWTEFDLVDLVIQVVLKIERRLATNAPSGPLWTDNMPVPNPQVFQQLMKLEFEDWCKVNNVAAPFRGNFDVSNAFTWNYSTAISGAPSWQGINLHRYGTAYPHLEPWKLQGYSVEPTWWIDEYSGKAEGRRWSARMWNHITTGDTPSNRPEPTFAIWPCERTSVNITALATIDGYAPDDLLPPYWIPSSPADNRTGVADQASFTTMLPMSAIAVNNYAFGDGGPAESNWIRSIDHKYASLRCMYRVDPVRFTHYTFGEKFTSVAGLEVCNRTNKVLSHRDVVFHGDADDNGNTQLFDGVNQLYVNFFRYNALDLNGSEFKRAWTSWTTQLCYSVGSFLIDNTLTIDSTLFEMTPNDYAVEVKSAHHVRDVWADALYATITQQGSTRELPLGAGRDWKFSLSTHCPIARETKYYGTKKYRVTADALTDTFTMHEGTLDQAGWNAGNAVVFDLGILGILPNAIDDLSYYFIIPMTPTSFKIANSQIKAITGDSLNLLTVGGGTFYVAELDSTFYALEGKHTPILWKHFSLNSNDTRTFSPDIQLTGIQNIVDFVDGYSAYLTDQGIVFNDSTVLEYDSSTDRQITWQFVLESMIDTLYMNANSTTRNNSANFLIGELELNPFSKNVWIKHATGVVSEFNSLDNKDSSAMAIMYDRTGNRIDSRHYLVLRQDGITHLAATNQVFDGAHVDNKPTNLSPVAFSGLHAYFDEYEHVLMFNPYTIANALVYDSFLGISIARVHAYFEKQSESTKRPSVGGFVMKDGKFIQNYEHTAGNVLKYYDTFTVNENSDFVNYARRMLGYSPDESYMKNTNVTPKSQFLFYKGMIKAKGTVGSIQAYTNSKHFNSAEVDEFWAYRAFDFGDRRADISYTLNLLPQDTSRSHVKLQFVADTDSPVSEYFTKVAMTDVTRWPNFPAQVGSLQHDHNIFGTVITSDVLATIVPIGTKRIIFHATADAVVLHQTGATLVEGTHYTRLAAGMVEITTGDVRDDLRIATCNVDYETVSPVHIYDEKAKTVVQNIPAWDPMADIHRAELHQYLSMMSDIDPALYNAAPNTANNSSTQFWNTTETGKIWLDTNSFSYVAYKDLYLTTNQRLLNWGKLEEWSDPAVYQWTESTSHPKDWTDGTPRREVYTRSRELFTSVVTGTTLTTVTDHNIVVGSEIAICSSGELPTPLLPGIVYIAAAINGRSIVLADREGQLVHLVSAGTGSITISTAAYSGAWTIVIPTVEHYYGILISATHTLQTKIAQGQEFSLFANGVFVQDGPVLAGGVVQIDQEVIDAMGANVDYTNLTVLWKTGIIDGLSTTPVALDLTPTTEQSYVGYPHTKVDHIAPNGVTIQPLYYFWVRGKSGAINDAQTVTTTLLESLVSINHDSYMICQNPVVVDGEQRMSQLILAGAAGIASESKRFTLRMRKNFSLRHKIMNATGSQLKTTHSEWIMFREHQNQHIDRSLWNMVMESVIGYTLNDSSVGVPSLDRTIYDNVNGTSTRFGIGAGQAFVSGSAALDTIMLVLNSPEIDFKPIDIDYFLETHDTTTAAELLQFMNDIYESFPAKHVNALFFAVMMDALARADVDYSASLMKTSAISINGITPLNVNGEFDE